jgi:hypothetical protein
MLARCCGVLLDQLGRIHLEGPGQLTKRRHARFDLVPLDPGDGRRGDAGALGQLHLGQRATCPTISG